MDFVTTHINGLSCAIQIIFSSIIKVFRDSKAYFNLFPLAPVRCFLNRFAYKISLRVLVFFSLFR